MIYILIKLAQVPETCNHPNLLLAIKYIFFIIKIICIVTPILMILSIMINLVKSLLGNTDYGKVSKDIINKLLLGITIFLIPSILNIILSFMGNFGDFNKCIDIATNEDLTELTEEYNEQKKTEEEKLKKELEEAKEKLPAQTPSTGPTTGGSDEQLFNLIRMFEGGNDANCTVNGQPGYLAKNYGDRTVTVGPGITTAVKKDLKAGTCYSKAEIDALYINKVKTGYYAPVQKALDKYNIKWPEYKKHALTSLSYQSGPGKAVTAIDTYAKYGEKAMIDYIKERVYAQDSKLGSSIWCGLPKRRDAEIDLYYTGKYPTQISNKLKYYKQSDSISKQIKSTSVKHHGGNYCKEISFSS